MEALCVSIPETKNLLGVGRTKIYELINEGRLEVVKIGRRTLVKTASIRALVEESTKGARVRDCASQSPSQQFQNRG
jgi:excisionase family DNA binding protein